MIVLMRRVQDPEERETSELSMYTWSIFCLSFFEREQVQILAVAGRSDITI